MTVYVGLCWCVIGVCPCVLGVCRCVCVGVCRFVYLCDGLCRCVFVYLGVSCRV